MKREHRAVCFWLGWILALGVLLPAASQPKKLVLGVQANPPMMFVRNHAYRGFIVDVVRDFARRNGYTLEFREASFFELLDQLRSGKIDMTAPLAYTLERARDIQYTSDSLVTTWSHIVLPATAACNTLFDLNGRSMGVVRGDFSYGFLKKDAEQNGIRIRFVEYNRYEEIVEAVLAGRLDSGFLSRFSLLYLMRKPEVRQQLKTLPQSFYPANLYIGVNPRRDRLLNDLNRFVSRSKADPESVLNQSFRYWFTPDPPQKGVMAYRTLMIVMAAILLVMGFIMGFNILLRRRVRRATVEIQRRQRYFQDLLQSIPVGILILDAQQLVLDVNREFEKMFGFNRKDLLGTFVDQVIRAPENREETRKFVLKTRYGTRDVEEARRLTREGQPLLVQIISTPTVTGPDNSGSIRIYIDLTEKNRLEQEIIKARHIESLGLLAGGIAHDFNNMLTGITGNISLARRLTRNPRITSILDKAETAVGKSRELTRQLLTFSKGGMPRKQSVDLAGLVKDMAELSLSGAEHIRLDLDLPDNLPPIHVDPGQISQVFTNLIINARQAMNRRGRLTVRARMVRRERDTEYLSPGEYIRVNIIDTGCGIPSSDLERIFSPYFSTKPGGTGLGLSISFSIVRKHRGHIQVRSTPGRGSEFTLFLPLPAGEKGSKAEDLSLPANARILVMDDDTAIREFFEDMARVFHLTLDTAPDHDRTVAHFRARMKAATPYHLVFLDLVIPGGPGGTQTLKKLQQLDPEVRAVAMSGYSDNPQFAHPRRDGFRDFLSKPFGIDELAAVLRRMFSSSGPAAPGSDS